MTEAKRNLLFVDDEPMVLQGYRRMMRELRREWKAEFVDHANKAIEKLEESPVELIISDMVMPEIKGTDLLETVSQRWHGTARILLTGSSDTGQLLLPNLTSPVQHCLYKPTDQPTLIDAVKRLAKLQKRLAALGQAEGALKVEALANSTEEFNKLWLNRVFIPSNEEIAGTLDVNANLAGDVVHLINSGVLPGNQSVSRIDGALSLLHPQIIQWLTLIATLWGNEDAAAQTHRDEALKLGYLAAQISRDLQRSMEESAEAFTAGVLNGYGQFLTEQESFKATGAAFSPEETAIVATQSLGISLNIAEALDQFKAPDEQTTEHAGPWLALHLANAVLTGDAWMESLNDTYPELNEKKDRWKELADATGETN